MDPVTWFEPDPDLSHKEEPMMEVREVKVGPHRYRVEKSQAGIDRAGIETRNVLLGHCDSRELKITVAPDLPPSVEAETLLHEVLHACMDLAGLRGDLGDEEDVVTRLSPALLQVLRENRWLTDYLGG